MSTRKKKQICLGVSKYCHTFALAKANQAIIGAVVQLVRILACHARGRGFESRPHRRGKPKGFPLFIYPYSNTTATLYPENQRCSLPVEIQHTEKQQYTKIKKHVLNPPLIRAENMLSS